MANSLTINGLAWINYTTNSNNLIFPVLANLIIYDEVIIAQCAGNYQNQLKWADGVVIDNLLNDTPITVQIGPLVSVVPAFQKDILRLYGTQTFMSVTGGGVVRLNFYTGDYAGSTYGSNSLEAQIVANNTTLSNGSIDAWFNTLRVTQGFALPAASDLNVLLDGGFYDVQAPLNGPGASTYSVEVTQYSGSNAYVRQIATDLFAANAPTWIRNRVVGVWGAWRRIETASTASEFMAIYSASQLISNGYTFTPCGAVVFNIGGNYDGNGTYTAPVAGLYEFCCGVQLTGGTAYTGSGGPSLFLNGVFHNEMLYSTGQNYAGGTLTTLIQMAAGQYVQMFTLLQGQTAQPTIQANRTYFGGRLVKQT